jgi:hypothetical protein
MLTQRFGRERALGSPAPEKKPYKIATMTAPAASLTAITEKLMTPHASVEGTRSVNTPVRSAIIVGKTRPKALDPFKIAICRHVSVQNQDTLGEDTHRVECKVNINSMLDGVQLEEQRWEENAQNEKEGTSGGGYVALVAQESAPIRHQIRHFLLLRWQASAHH